MKVVIHIDGACRGNPGPASVGVSIADATGKTLKEFCRYIGETTNNVAEYTALEEALRLAASLGATRVCVRSDSQLLVRQFNGQYRVKNPRLMEHLLTIQRLRRSFESVELVHVPREENKRADRLANDALDAVKKSPDGLPGTPLELLKSQLSRELLK